jgi:hypothetical protein
MTLATLEHRILELTRAATPRRTVMTQCKLAGHTPEDTMNALIALLEDDAIEHVYRPRGSRERPVEYRATGHGRALLGELVAPA